VNVVRGILLAVALTGAGASLPALAQVIDTPAEYAVIMDHETGQILFSKRGDELMTPASMTKMMTAFVVFELIERGEISLTDKFTVSEDAWRRGGFPSGTSTMGLVPKDCFMASSRCPAMMLASFLPKASRGPNPRLQPA
jgi:serine-type D-Ala-D-Ala carboxypeptidase (penicillin-binding protein 5/6)